MFNTNKENKDYLNFATFGLYMLMVDRNVPKTIQNEANKIHSAIRKYEKETKCSIGEVTISKDSTLGQYVIQPNNGNIYRDLNVNILTIANAFNISVFEDNPISKDIYPLFKNQVSGTMKALSEEYGEELINYIVDNNNFEYFLDVLNGTYQPKEYNVYENNSIKKKKLVQNVKNLKFRKNEK